ncbi:hypothetical protein COB52_05915 [Candidatus Kaiserbacteria bacterium]|nr:MAG: hypothetical protein COB52_05915 [Candidatus Kaiserbacteria bacterium]
MSEKNVVRVILKRCRTGGHGELLSEEYKTVEIFSEDIERLMVGQGIFGKFSVIGAELMDPEASHAKFEKDDMAWAYPENDTDA